VRGSILYAATTLRFAADFVMDETFLGIVSKLPMPNVTRSFGPDNVAP